MLSFTTIAIGLFQQQQSIISTERGCKCEQLFPATPISLS
uniref:Uncharacterized protein n=1 Tax=Anguilla anguilla TaxID=7936 RepID=A0A0E9U1W7_ANGAN